MRALVGVDVLPAGVVPVTSAVTILRYGERLSARVRLHASGWRTCEPRSLSEYASDEKNPGNRKGISGIGVFVPNALLRTGMCLVDTRGLGSAIAANASTTEAFAREMQASGGDAVTARLAWLDAQRAAVVDIVSSSRSESRARVPS